MAERLVIEEGEVRVRDEELAYAEEELRTLRADEGRIDEVARLLRETDKHQFYRLKFDGRHVFISCADTKWDSEWHEGLRAALDDAAKEKT